MTEVIVAEHVLELIKDKVIIVTGGSSGIGHATIQLLLSLGASVVNGDLHPPQDFPEQPNLLYVQTDVVKWVDLTNLFKKTIERFGRIDHVFANAGLSPRANYLELGTDDDGNLQEPEHLVLNVMLRGVINTATLGVHYQKQQDGGGSIVLMGSSTSLQPLRAPDYSTAKHGVLGYGRGLARLVEVAKLPIRVNTIAPCWTSTSLLPEMQAVLDNISHTAQSPVVVAGHVINLMVDASRHGEVLFVSDGRCKEIEKSILFPTYQAINGLSNPTDDEIMARMDALARR